MQRLALALEGWLFGRRAFVLGFFALATVAMIALAAQLRIDAGFEKQLPIKHPYMQTFLQYQEQFGGANRVLIALRARQGDIFTPEFFTALKGATDDTFFIQGIDRARVTSIFTPNVRFIEIVEDGFAGGNVIPADFAPTPQRIEDVRENILKSGQVGRLVAEDFSAALIIAELVDRDPRTGERLDYLQVAAQLEKNIREKYESDAIAVHIIGFAKVMGDIADGAAGVLLFFLISVVITAILVFFYTRSGRLTLLPLLCSLVAVIWQMGLLVLLGYGIDPMSILIPFLVFAIGVSHGVQMVNAVGTRVLQGKTSIEAARESFRLLLVPGSVALLTDVLGFATLLLIEVPIIQELAVTASLGVAVIILTNLLLLPVLLSFQTFDEKFRGRLSHTLDNRSAVFTRFAVFTRPRFTVPAVLAAVALAAWGISEGRHLPIGDVETGVPELRADSRYNRDTAEIVSRFAIGVDLIQVIVEGPADGCIQYATINALDRFEWTMRNIEGVQSTISLATAMKTVNAGWNEGNLQWRVLPRDSQVLVRAVTPVETSTGLLNADCSVMPVLIFTRDHKAETIARIVAAVKAYAAEHETTDGLRYRLATGNVGVMAATNEAVAAAQLPMLLWVYAAVTLLCLALFRSVWGVLCVILPLALVSVLANALMSVLEIGLKVPTLPVLALGVGVGIDYGIYIFTTMQRDLREGYTVAQAYTLAMWENGSAVLLTGLTLAAGVSTWLFSALKFQADMGLLLTFMFLVNMLGAVFLIPALASLFNRWFGAFEAPKADRGTAG
jgi:predicted RND superfamily exporter protein